MNKKERLLFAIGEVDEKYVKEAEFKVKISSIVKVAVAAVVVIALSLYLFIPFGPVTSDLSSYESSSYFPLIEEIEAYNLTFRQPRYKNNFMWLADEIDDLFGLFAGKGGAAAPGDGNMSGAPGMDVNGNYMESTDNQVDGVIESDLMKMTDKYIFRLTYGLRYDGNYGGKINIFSIDKENSDLVADYMIPVFDDELLQRGGWYKGEMFLSEDGNTLTLVNNYIGKEKNLSKVGITSLDVSDIQNIKIKSRVSIDGSLNTSRMVDGKLLIINEFFFNRNSVDYDDPTTFVPSINAGDGANPIEFEDIIYPNSINNTRYSVVTLLDAEDLALLGSVAALNFTNDVYVSRDNVYITREYTEVLESDGKVIRSEMTDIAVINYSGESLLKRDVIKVRGTAEDQYSFDERDGYLRVVTSTGERIQATRGNSTSTMSVSNNVSLFVFDLQDNNLAYSLEDFAIEGEEATAVRFDGDKVYVCTAVVVNFTDPVYFIDLSNYENITYNDTGIIEGYSDHLINFGDGFALGIGREDWQFSKVEVYEQNGPDVDSVDEYKFKGGYSLDYKAYLVNRDNMIFGFGTEFFSEEGFNQEYRFAYVILFFNGYEFQSTVVDMTQHNTFPEDMRAAYVDGYIYITTDLYMIKVVKVN